MIIKKYTTLSKKCDKCNKKSIVKGKIQRISFAINPNYEYIGFDLCSKCLIEFKIMVSNFIEIKGGIK